MTQSSLQTQCPKCLTRFRVTDEQLGVAKGKVRCGHCMDVFNAIEHKVTSATVATPKTPSEISSKKPSEGTQPNQPVSGFSSDTTEDNFVFADNPEEDAEEGRYAGTKLTFSDDELSDSFRSFDDRAPSAQDDTVDDDISEGVDESWAEAILQEDNAPEKSADTTPDSDKPPVKAEPEKQADAELEYELQPPLEPAPDPEVPAQTPDNKGHKDTSDFFDDDQSSLALESFDQEQDTELEPERPLKGERFAAEAPFGDLRHEPVSLGGNNRGWLRTAVWSVIVLGLIGVLVAQITWFQFDRLSAIPELRPFYEKGCELAGCELEPLINVDAIQSRKLVVRTDPENRNQLVVDAVIINRADFQQPFPAIALTFSNLNGDVVAQSIFTPEEYLAGEAEALKSMPVETPVRIAISIRDPGRDAVNYNIIFQPYAP